MALPLSVAPLLRSILTSSQIMTALRPVSKAGIWTWRDIPYAEPSVDPKHHVDVYAASEPFPRKLQPVCVFVHGGSWQRGDRAWQGSLYENVGVALARRGIVAVVPSYHLAPEHPHPAQVVDTLTAYAWAAANVKQFGGDPKRLFLAGHSAGGHVAFMAALHLMQAMAGPTAGDAPSGPAASRGSSSALQRAVAAAVETAQAPPQPRQGGDASATAVAADKPAAVTPASHTAPELSPPLPAPRGFIGLSGVYNVLRLGHSPFGPALVEPAFGPSESVWRAVSPVYAVMKGWGAGAATCTPAAGAPSAAQPAGAPPPKKVPLPPMLLLSAEHDFHLQTDAEELDLACAAVAGGGGGGTVASAGVPGQPGSASPAAAVLTDAKPSLSIILEPPAAKAAATPPAASVGAAASAPDDTEASMIDVASDARGEAVAPAAAAAAPQPVIQWLDTHAPPGSVYRGRVVGTNHLSIVSQMGHAAGAADVTAEAVAQFIRQGGAMR